MTLCEVDSVTKRYVKRHLGVDLDAINNEHERLTARVAELESQVELWSGEAGDNLRNGAELIKGLRQENERYRAALENIEAQGYWSAKYNAAEALVKILDENTDLARTALKEEKDG